MLYLYQILGYLLIPFLLVRLFWRGCKNSAYRQRISERFALGRSKPANKEVIWVHAVSVGEALAAVSLVRAIQQQYPNQSILVTTTTPTGSARVPQLLGDSVTHVYAPYDLLGVVKRFIKKFKPCLLILMETELWPNLLCVCKQQKIPILIANARLSARSCKGYQRLGNFMRNLLPAISMAAAQTAVDAQRFAALGVDPDRIQIAGNLKFSLQIPSDLMQRAQQLRQVWGRRPIWIAASTHEGEEEQILAALKRVRATIADVLLILVPRHPERFDKVANLCREQGYKIALRSAPQAYQSDIDIFLGDTMGELLLLYAAADVAFVGGSLVEVGGHNLLEPAILGIPSTTGPHIFNFKDIAEQLAKVSAAWLVNNPAELAAHVITLLQNEPLRKASGEQGKTFVLQQQHQALNKHLQLLEALFAKL